MQHFPTQQLNWSVLVMRRCASSAGQRPCTVPNPSCLQRHITIIPASPLADGGSVAEWGAWWTRRAWVQIAVATLSGNSLRQTVHSHSASVHQAAKLVAALLRAPRVTVGLAESNGSLPPGLWLTSPAGWLQRTGISSGTLRSVIKYGLPLPLLGC